MKFKPEWEKRELTVELSVEGDVESVNGDPQLLSTAFKHLLVDEHAAFCLCGNYQTNTK